MYCFVKIAIFSGVALSFTGSKVSFKCNILLAVFLWCATRKQFGTHIFVPFWVICKFTVRIRNYQRVKNTPNGWRGFHFVAIFENGHIPIDWLYFYEFNSKKSANFAARVLGTLAAKFSFSKKHRDFKNKYFLLKICRNLSYTLKNNCQKENSKLQFV